MASSLNGEKWEGLRGRREEGEDRMGREEGAGQGPVKDTKV